MTLQVQRDVANQEWTARDVTSRQGLPGPRALWRPLAAHGGAVSESAPIWSADSGRVAASGARPLTPPGDSGHFPSPHGQRLREKLGQGTEMPREREDQNSPASNQRQALSQEASNQISGSSQLAQASN